MEKALVTAGIFLSPTLLLVVAFKLSGRKINWVPLLSAGLASLVYIALLKSRNVIPIPALLETLPLIWFGKILSLSGTIAMLFFLPRVGFQEAGLTWTQNSVRDC